MKKHVQKLKIKTDSYDGLIIAIKLARKLKPGLTLWRTKGHHLTLWFNSEIDHVRRYADALQDKTSKENYTLTEV